MVRVRAGRNSQPSAGIIDSQTVKMTSVGGIRGYDGGKKITGRKRHVLVDTQGWVLKAKVHATNIQDRDGGKLVLIGLHEPFLILTWKSGMCRFLNVSSPPTITSRPVPATRFC